MPRTHDLVQTLFSFTAKKTACENAVLVVMGLEVLLFLNGLPREFFLVLFVFWRAAYNLGLGLLLREQSRGRSIVKFFRRRGFSVAEGHRSWIARLLVSHVSTKIAPEFRYADVPVEFKAWLVFRVLVDMVLLNDFMAYVLFSCAYFVPPAQIEASDVLRWCLGGALIGFNVWVKLDALRVVKDYAWYWGDFFFVVDAALTFDGVFELAPHPMVSPPRCD